VFEPDQVLVRVEAVRARIRRAARPRLDGHEVKLVAVTKGFGADAVRAALGAGVDGLGENYAQEMLAKAAVLAAEGHGVAPWHFIGQLQRNKVRQIASLVDLWQSVDRPSLATEVARRSPGARVLVQVNCSGEPQRGGADWPEVPTLVRHCASLGLQVDGLMGVGPGGDDPEASRSGFRRLVALADDLGLTERSIGMSADLEVAVEEGSTMVRVGRDLFGPRPVKQPTAARPEPPEEVA
jgi:PLP dependent protein